MDLTSTHNEEASAIGAAPAPKEHDVGVLLVHGIGQQPEGDTLLGFGEPLIRWLDRWLRRERAEGVTGSFEVLSTRLTPSRSGDDVPPHAIAKLALQNDQKTSSTWLMAESWWGGDVQPPPFGKFAGWLLTIGAWSAVAHTTKWSANIKEGPLRTIADVAATIAGLVLAIGLQLAVLTLAILAIPPIPPLRKRLSSILLAMTGVLGDCYVLVESDLQRGAIVTRTRAALRWLAERCERVVVIAHSQGAAVAHYTLRSASPPNVDLLLTLGSGLGKLSELEHSGRTMGRVRTMARVAPLLLLLVAVLAYVMFFEQRDSLASLALYFLAFSVFIAVTWSVLTARYHWRSTGKRAGELSLLSARPGLRWIDIHATRDPVPNGELLPGGARVDGMMPLGVVNHASVVGDHTTYWENRCEFIPWVLRAMDGALGLGLFARNEEQALDAVARRHRRAVWWFSAARWAAALSIVVLFWRYGDDLLIRGRDLAQSLSGSGTPFAALLSRIEAITMFFLRLFFRDGAIDAGYRLLGAALPIALIVAWQYGYRFLWRWWDNVALEDVFRPGSIGRADHAVLSATVIGLGFVPLISVVFWPVLQDIAVGRTLALGWIGLSALLMVVIALQVTIRSVRLLSASRTAPAGARQQLKEDVRTLGNLGLFFAVLLFITLPAFEPWHDAAIFGGLGVALMYLQFWVATRASRLSWSRAIRTAVLFGPALVAASLTVTLVLVLGPQQGTSGAASIPALVATFGLEYALLLVGAALAVRRARRD